jgi:hypothetical protein
MNSIYNYIVTFIAGALLMHLWKKFINRISVLRYSVFYQHIAISSNLPGIGSIEVLHNSIPVKSLYFSTVKIINDTNRDLSNIEFNLTCDPNSIIITSQGMNKSSGKNVDFTDRYSKLLSNDKEENVKNILSFRDYLVPVINRGDTIEFTLLIVNELANFPFVTVSCDCIGVKIKFQAEPRQKLFGESTPLSAIIGIIITTIVCYLLIYFNLSPTLGVWLAFLLGLTTTFFGLLVIKIFKKLRRLFT